VGAEGSGVTWGALGVEGMHAEIVKMELNM